MRIEPHLIVKSFCIHDSPALDSVTVFLQSFEGKSGAGRIVINCYGRAWSAFFGAMGEGWTIERFLNSCDADYLAGKMQLPNDKKRDKAYLLRIVEVVLSVIKDEYENREYNPNEAVKNGDAS